MAPTVCRNAGILMDTWCDPNLTGISTNKWCHGRQTAKGPRIMCCRPICMKCWTGGCLVSLKNSWMGALSSACCLVLTAAPHTKLSGSIWRETKRESFREMPTNSQKSCASKSFQTTITYLRFLAKKVSASSLMILPGRYNGPNTHLLCP